MNDLFRHVLLGTVSILVLQCSRPSLRPELLIIPNVPLSPCVLSKKLECDAFPARTMCYVDTFENRFFPDRYAPRSFGASECDARAALTAELCRIGLDPNAQMTVYCVPDPMDGACASLGEPCPEAEGEQTICTANQYEGRDLSKDQRPFGFGSGPCEARRAMKLAACATIMNPVDLNGVECAAAASSSCSPSVGWCRLQLNPVDCELSVEGAASPLKVFARNVCEANAAMREKICSVNLAVTEESMNAIRCRSPE